MLTTMHTTPPPPQKKSSSIKRKITSEAHPGPLTTLNLLKLRITSPFTHSILFHYSTIVEQTISRMAASEGSGVEALTVSLNSLHSLRSVVTQFLQTIADGPKYENDQDGEGDLQEVAVKAMGEIRNKLR